MDPVPLLELVGDQRLCTFPMIAEVEKDMRNLPRHTSSGRPIAATDRPRLEPGVILWILRYCKDEATGRKAVRVCRGDAVYIEFPVLLEEPLMVLRRSYSAIAHRLSATTKAPMMDLSVLANLVAPDEPVFAVSSEEQEKTGERILIHATCKVRAYLVRGRKHPLVIPVDFKGVFHRGTDPSINILPTFENIEDILSAQWQGEIKVMKTIGVVYSPHVDMIYENDIIKMTDTRSNIDTNVSSDEPQTVAFVRIKSEKGGKPGDINVSISCKGEFKACYSLEETQKEINLQSYKGDYPFVMTYTADNSRSKSDNSRSKSDNSRCKSDNSRSNADNSRSTIDNSRSKADSNRSSSADYMVSKDGEILRADSPLVVHGICSFTETHTTIVKSSPSRIQCQLKEVVPSYYPKSVRASSSIPVHIQEIKDFSKLHSTVGILTGEQYISLSQTLESKSGALDLVRKSHSLKDLRDLERDQSIPTHPLLKQRVLLNYKTNEPGAAAKPTPKPRLDLHRHRHHTFTSGSTEDQYVDMGRLFGAPR